MENFNFISWEFKDSEVNIQGEESWIKKFEVGDEDEDGDEDEESKDSLSLLYWWNMFYEGIVHECKCILSSNIAEHLSQEDIYQILKFPGIFYIQKMMKMELSVNFEEIQGFTEFDRKLSFNQKI